MNYQDYLDELFVEVIDLISYPSEGSYWDFKREWYFMDKKADSKKARKGRQDLLLDIVNMANNLHFRDAYIIIGVDNGSHETIGVPEGDTNQRSTEQLTDFLAECRFVNGVHPEVRVETLSHNELRIDVIVVKSSRDVPFYLAEPYGDGVRAGVVYARQNGRNTPCSKSASSYAIERLWRHRFLLDATPYEHFLDALRDRSAWTSSPERGAPEKDYLKTAPEYTIDYSSSDDDIFDSGPEFYCCNQCDSRVSYFPITGRYHQTVLFERLGVCLDGGRYQTSIPDWGFLHKPGKPMESEGYKYYIKESENWLIHRYLLDEHSGEALAAHARFMENVLVFETRSERTSFEKYVERNWGSYEDLKTEADPFVPSQFADLLRIRFEKDLRTTHALRALLNEWRASERK